MARCPSARKLQELEVPDGYTSSVEGSAAQGFTITNKHTSKGTGTSITSGNNTTTPANNKPSTAASSGKKGRVKTPSTGDVPHKEFWVILIVAGAAALLVVRRAMHKGKK